MSLTVDHFRRSGFWHGSIKAGGTESLTVFGATTVSVVVQPAKIRRHRLIEKRTKVRILLFHVIELLILYGEFVGKLAVLGRQIGRQTPIKARLLRHGVYRGDSLPDKVYVADLSLAYNIGTGAFCRSSIVRLQNAGQLRASCDRFPLYNKAGGRTISGLVKRRGKEQVLCIEGLR
jgi:hypothetical protein